VKRPVIAAMIHENAFILTTTVLSKVSQADNPLFLYYLTLSFRQLRIFAATTCRSGGAAPPPATVIPLPFSHVGRKKSLRRASARHALNKVRNVSRQLRLWELAQYGPVGAVICIRTKSRVRLPIRKGDQRPGLRPERFVLRNSVDHTTRNKAVTFPMRREARIGTIPKT